MDFTFLVIYSESEKDSLSNFIHSRISIAWWSAWPSLPRITDKCVLHGLRQTWRL